MDFSEADLKAFLKQLQPKWTWAYINNALITPPPVLVDIILKALLENPSEPACSLALAWFDQLKEPFVSYTNIDGWLLINFVRLARSLNPKISQTFKDFLDSLTPSTVAQSLFFAWHTQRDEVLFEFLLQPQWQHFLEDYPQYQLAFLLKAGLMTPLLYMSKFESVFDGKITELLELARDKDPEIAQRTRTLLTELPSHWLKKNLFNNSDERLADNALLHLLNELDAENSLLLERVNFLLTILLEKYENYFDTTHFWSLWQASRNPYLADALQKIGRLADSPPELKILSALKLNEPKLLWQWGYRELKFVLAACDDSDSQVAETAHWVLLNLPNTKLDNLARLWLESRSEILESVFRAAGQLPHSPLDARVLLALLLGKEKELRLSVGKVDIIPILVGACDDTNPQISQAARTLLPAWVALDVKKQQALCQTILNVESSFANQLALEKGYEPLKPTDRALFFFFTEQWQRYETLDIEFQVLRSAYKKGEATIRHRIAAKIRQSGRADYLSIISSEETASRNKGFTLTEAEVIVQNLNANADWQKLWKAVLVLPLQWSVAAIQRLAETDWQPANNIDKELFAQLKNLVQGNIITTQAEIFEQGLLTKPLVKKQFGAADNLAQINDIAFPPVGYTLAVALSQQDLTLWNWQSDTVEKNIAGFRAGVGRVAFMPDQSLLCADAAGSWQSPTKVYHCRPLEEDVKLRELANQRGAISHLQVLDEERVIWSGQNRQVVLWNMRENSITALYEDARVWARHLVLPKHEKCLALLHDGITILKFPEFSQLKQKFHASVDWPNVLAACLAPDEKSLLISRADKRLAYYELSQDVEPQGTTSDFGLHYFGEIRPRQNAVVGLATIPNLPIFLAATKQGTLEFIDWGSREINWKLELPHEKPTAFRVSPDGYFLAVGRATVGLTVWDLRVLHLPQFFALNTVSPRASQLATLNLLAQSENIIPISPAVRATLAYLKLTLEYRARFDIELADFSALQAAALDIEL